MTQLTNMQLTDTEKKDFSTPSVGPVAPKFPHGLTLRLGPEELKKLGFLSAPKLKDKLLAMAKVEVTEVSKKRGEEDTGELDFSLELQITDLALKGEEQRPQSPSQVIYGEEA